MILAHHKIMPLHLALKILYSILAYKAYAVQYYAHGLRLKGLKFVIFDLLLHMVHSEHQQQPFP
jgi:hypothetical protein